MGEQNDSRQQERPLVHTVSEFATFLKEQDVEANELIFRGQSRASWQLVPTAFRRKESDLSKRNKTEVDMLKEFKRMARPYLIDRPADTDEWEWLALAQHYGLPTRLLDWTENAAAALFFAVERPNEGKASTVWYTTRPEEKREGSPFNVDGIYLYRPPHILPRITVQQACFTIHPTNYVGHKYKWPADLHRIDIPFESRAGILCELRSLGIHRASLFPDPAGVAAELKRRHGFEKDEEDEAEESRQPHETA